jgi:hypothetical protein
VYNKASQDRPLWSVVSHYVSNESLFTQCYILETTDPSGLLLSVSRLMLDGEQTTPAISVVSRLGVSRCNTAHIGGEASADSTNDWRVLWLRDGTTEGASR